VSPPPPAAACRAGHELLAHDQRGCRHVPSFGCRKRRQGLRPPPPTAPLAVDACCCRFLYWRQRQRWLRRRQCRKHRRSHRALSFGLAQTASCTPGPVAAAYRLWWRRRRRQRRPTPPPTASQAVNTRVDAGEAGNQHSCQQNRSASSVSYRLPYRSAVANTPRCSSAEAAGVHAVTAVSFTTASPYLNALDVRHRAEIASERGRQSSASFQEKNVTEHQESWRLLP